MAIRPVWPSAYSYSVGVPEGSLFRGWIPGLRVPLSTLRLHPRECRRM